MVEACAAAKLPPAGGGSWWSEISATNPDGRLLALDVAVVLPWALSYYDSYAADASKPGGDEVRAAAARKGRDSADIGKGRDSAVIGRPHLAASAQCAEVTLLMISVESGIRVGADMLHLL